MAKIQSAGFNWVGRVRENIVLRFFFFFGLNECYVELNTNETVEKLLLSGKLGSARAVFAHYVALGLIDQEIIQAK